MKNVQILFLLWVGIITSCNSPEHSKRVFMTSVETEPAPPPVGEKRNKIIPLPDVSYNNVPRDAISEEEKYAEENLEEEVATTDDLNAGSAQNKPALNKQKIIKDGSMSIKAKNVAVSKKNMDLMIKQYNAYYETEVLQNDDRITSYDLKIRIPSENFEKAIASIENGEDEITNKSIQARDVTEEYVDIETRLINKREFLKRYKELLSKAGTVKDILSIEENIRTIQEEIESREGRLKYLNDQIAYSTLTVNLYREKEYVYKATQQYRFSERLKDAVSSGWGAIKEFILSIFAAWPMVIICCIIFIFIRRFIKKRKAKKKIEISVVAE